MPHKPLSSRIKRLILPQKGRYMRQLYPDEYYEGYWPDKKTCDGIDLVAAIEQIPRRQVVLNLIEAGFKHYILEKTKQHLDNEVELHQRGEDPVVGRFIKLLRHYAKQNGIDISKIL
jgi:hypothetical protein